MCKNRDRCTGRFFCQQGVCILSNSGTVDEVGFNRITNNDLLAARTLRGNIHPTDQPYKTERVLGQGQDTTEYRPSKVG